MVFDLIMIIDFDNGELILMEVVWYGLRVMVLILFVYVFFRIDWVLVFVGFDVFGYLYFDCNKVIRFLFWNLIFNVCFVVIDLIVI